eukprot:TRINITY_DN1991_c0_g1_i10.p1 TRINITY_DN1991_c0_g1~~TRINITY_DN1991_c0_g1_i10.p1  ORF type:complete len:450 (+),score=215.33 TRINITY_DN1991_c0_g1_i10:198-1547(+)
MPMDLETLKKELVMKKEKLLEERIKRNYIQMEKEMIADFYNGTRKELDETHNMIIIHDHDIEQMEEDHKIEMTVYMRKLQYLEYEHQNKDTKLVATNAQNAMSEEKKDFVTREEEQKKLKKSLMADYKKNDTKSVDDIKLLEEKQANLLKIEQNDLENSKNRLIEKYEEKLENLKRDLELRIKVEMHELDERKHKHINNLCESHKKQYDEVKNSYNAMTKQHLSLIKQTMSDKEDIDRRTEAIKKRIKDLQDKINMSEGPKQKAEIDLKAAEKDLWTYIRSKMPLGSARARLELLRENYKKMLKDKEDLDEKYRTLDHQKMDMYRKFDEAMGKLQRQTDYRNAVLENKLGQLQDEYDKKEPQLRQVIQQAGFEQKFVDEITNRMEEAIEAKNSLLRSLKYSLAHAQKAYNDAIRVYEAKLVEFGIPEEELGLQPIETNTSTMPAGLVAA